MPMLQVNLLKGYNSEIKQRLMRALTAVVRGSPRPSPMPLPSGFMKLSPIGTVAVGSRVNPGLLLPMLQRW